jgi:DNA-binding MurR/RpiR family transcriptional regulator
MSNAVPGCLVRINALYSQLRDSEKRVADYIRGGLDTVIHQSITEVAESAGASESTVVRLCKALDYRGFQDFKIHLAQEHRAPASQIHEAIGAEDDLPSIKKKVFESDVLAITETLKVLDDAAFAEAVRLVSSARRLEFYGTGGSGSVALDAQHKFLKIGRKPRRTPTPTSGHVRKPLAPGTWRVHLPLRREQGDPGRPEIATRNGAAVVAITNYGRSPITRLSDATLFTAAGETAFKSDALSSRIAEWSSWTPCGRRSPSPSTDASFDTYAKPGSYVSKKL